jgi:RNA polymerase sigma-70 factor (ECF subfamily)
MHEQDIISAFEAARPVLMGLAYRMLGSRADAEDAVQDTFLKWQKAARQGIENSASWLTTACTRRCIDLLRSARKSRVDYVGAWLPEPIHTAGHHEVDMSLASSLSTAFLLMLERLTPRERAAYLLHEIFEVSYSEVAKTLGMNETSCRKLVSRACANIGQSKVRYVTPIDRQEKLLAAFQEAIMSGNTEKLAELFSDDVEIRHDSGGKVGAAVHVLNGKDDVLEFVERFLHRVWKRYRWRVADLNGGRGVILEKDGEITAAVSFAYDASARVTNIYIMRNPDKLARLSKNALHFGLARRK